MLLRPEQNSDALIKTMVNKYTEHGDLVLDPFTELYSTRRTFTLLTENIRCAIGHEEAD